MACHFRKKPQVPAREPVLYPSIMRELQERLTDELVSGTDPFKPVWHDTDNPRNSQPYSEALPGWTLLRDNTTIGSPLRMDQRQQILLLSTWRSGSSLLGDLLSNLPGAFYTFEPLYMYYWSGAMPARDKVGKDIMELILDCKLQSELKKRLGYWTRDNEVFFTARNLRTWDVCSTASYWSQLCYHPKLWQQTCAIYPTQVIKTVRLRVSDAKAFLKNTKMYPNLKAVVLVRDPRGVIHSRRRFLQWCNTPACANTTVVCDHMSRDLSAARALVKRYPERVILVRYEDLIQDPYHTVDRLFGTLGLPRTQYTENFLSSHMGFFRNGTPTTWNGNTFVKEGFSTVRKSNQKGDRWRREMDMYHIKKIQSKCWGTINDLGFDFL